MRCCREIALQCRHDVELTGVRLDNGQEPFVRTNVDEHDGRGDLRRHLLGPLRIAVLEREDGEIAPHPRC